MLLPGRSGVLHGCVAEPVLFEWAGLCPRWRPPRGQRDGFWVCVAAFVAQASVRVTEVPFFWEPVCDPSRSDLLVSGHFVKRTHRSLHRPFTAVTSCSFLRCLGACFCVFCVSSRFGPGFAVQWASFFLSHWGFGGPAPQPCRDEDAAVVYMLLVLEVSVGNHIR